MCVSLCVCEFTDWPCSHLGFYCASTCALGLAGTLFSERRAKTVVVKSFSSHVKEPWRWTEWTRLWRKLAKEEKAKMWEPSGQMWQSLTHTHTQTLALAASMSCESIMCQNSSKLCQQGLPQENPSPSPLALRPFLAFWLLLISSSLKPLSCLFLTSSSQLHLQSPFLPAHLQSPQSPHLSISFSALPLSSHPPSLHLRTWQSYHYHATYLLAACYFPFALRGPRAKSLPTILDPSHRIYPRVAWQVRSTSPVSPLLFLFLLFSFFLFLWPSLSFCLSFYRFFPSMAAYANTGPPFHRAVYP